MLEFYFRFRFSRLLAIGMSFCICLPNFIEVGPSVTELWHHIHFPRWRPQHRNSTSGFVFVTSLIWEGRNFSADEISAKYLNPRLRYYKFRFLITRGGHVGILLPVSIFTFASPSACYTASACQILSKSGHPRHSYNVMSIFQDGAHTIAIWLPVSSFVTSLIWEGYNLPTDHISARYLTPRLRYYYFRFLKTHDCHVGILLPVSIFTFSSPSACHSAPVHQILSKLDHPRHS